MSRPNTYVSGALLTFALISPACGSDDPVTPISPTPPAEITEAFDGNLTVNGAATHLITVTRAGTLSARLAVLDPDATVVISLSLGTWNGSACHIIIAKDDAIQGSIVTGTASVAGSFCTRVMDAGKLTSPTAYQIVVTHF